MLIPTTFGFWALWEALTLSFSLTVQENLVPLLKVLGSRAFVRYLSSNELPCMAHHTLGSAAPTRALMGARGRPVHCHVATHHPHYSPPHDGLLTKKNIKTAITTVPSMAPQHHENHTRPDRQTTKNVRHAPPPFRFKARGRISKEENHPQGNHPQGQTL